MLDINKKLNETSESAANKTTYEPRNLIIHGENTSNIAPTRPQLSPSTSAVQNSGLLPQGCAPHMQKEKKNPFLCDMSLSASIKSFIEYAN